MISYKYKTAKNQRLAKPASAAPKLVLLILFWDLGFSPHLISNKMKMCGNDVQDVKLSLVTGNLGKICLMRCWHKRIFCLEHVPHSWSQPVLICYNEFLSSKLVIHHIWDLETNQYRSIARNHYFKLICISIPRSNSRQRLRWENQTSHHFNFNNIITMITIIITICFTVERRGTKLSVAGRYKLTDTKL